MVGEDEETIQLRCPQCGQRFRINQELKGRMVECGACKYRFRVDDQSVVRNKKFYPGERREIGTGHFARVPAKDLLAPPSLQTTEYAEAPNFARFEPVPFGRILVGLVGGAMMVFVWLILILGGSKGGILDGVTIDRRFIIAAFAAVVGTIMILYANPGTRVKAIVFSLLGAIALLLAPVYFKEGTRPMTPGLISMETGVTTPMMVNDARKRIADLKETVGYKPMETALVEAGKNGSAVGIWMKGLQESNSQIVRNYLLRVSKSAEASHLYPRMNRSFLLVLINPQLSLEDVARQCALMGRVDQTVTELSLLEVTVDNSRFAERPIEQLTDKTNAAFYRSNLMELEGMDLKRINDALSRLATAEPKEFRDDIVNRMIQLLEVADLEMMKNLSNAFQHWSSGKDGAPDATLQWALKWYQANQTLPVETLQFLTTWHLPEIYPILDEMWAKSPALWEETYMKCGPLAEDYINKHLMEGGNNHRMSASRITGRVGTNKSIDALKRAMEFKADAELVTSFQNAINSINARNP